MAWGQGDADRRAVLVFLDGDHITGSSPGEIGAESSGGVQRVRGHHPVKVEVIEQWPHPRDLSGAHRDLPLGQHGPAVMGEQVHTPAPPVRA
ncbi:hypothetical protein [Amycolatopsis minnesotensis]|uniref:Uncharacterized protein n=1 Tax=Amycolatopsis minnesotensis TaxID=337894 RepID=A0ABN2QQ44_9PSEU